MLNDTDRLRGFTLIELMIAGLVSLITLSAVLTVYSATAGHSSQYLKQAHLHQQLQALVYLMSRDLKRAGYWRFDPALKSAAANPFQNTTNRLRAAARAGERRNSCILFAYDLDDDGLTGNGTCKNTVCPEGSDGDNVEQFGFRLSGGRVQSRFGGRETGCNRGYWQSLSDPNIEITRLQFTLHKHCLNLENETRVCGPGVRRLIRRAVEIQLHGQLPGRPDTRVELPGWVQIRNDQLQGGHEADALHATE